MPGRKISAFEGDKQRLGRLTSYSEVRQRVVLILRLEFLERKNVEVEGGTRILENRKLLPEWTPARLCIDTYLDSFDGVCIA